MHYNFFSVRIIEWMGQLPECGAAGTRERLLLSFLCFCSDLQISKRSDPLHFRVAPGEGVGAVESSLSPSSSSTVRRDCLGAVPSCEVSVETFRFPSMPLGTVTTSPGASGDRSAFPSLPPWDLVSPRLPPAPPRVCLPAALRLFTIPGLGATPVLSILRDRHWRLSSIPHRDGPGTSRVSWPTSSSSTFPGSGGVCTLICGNTGAGGVASRVTGCGVGTRRIGGWVGTTTSLCRRIGFFHRTVSRPLRGVHACTAWFIVFGRPVRVAGTGDGLFSWSARACGTHGGLRSPSLSDEVTSRSR